jgi:hypothetical protein
MTKRKKHIAKKTIRQRAPSLRARRKTASKRALDQLESEVAEGGALGRDFKNGPPLK